MHLLGWNVSLWEEGEHVIMGNLLLDQSHRLELCTLVESVRKQQESCCKTLCLYLQGASQGWWVPLMSLDGIESIVRRITFVVYLNFFEYVRICTSTVFCVSEKVRSGFSGSSKFECSCSCTTAF